MIQFKGFTSPDKLIASDPVNLVFYGGGTASQVERYLRDSELSQWVPPIAWRGLGILPSMTLWAHLDNTANGGGPLWKGPDLEMSIGPYFDGPRMHIRLYESPNRDTSAAWDQPGFGQWSIAAVHLEHWSAPLTHVVHGWLEAQELVEAWFDGQPGVGRVYRQDIGNEGWYQGHWHHGEATYIELV